MTMFRSKANYAIGAIALTAALWLGSGCGDGGRVTAATYCCTSGDPATAYFNSQPDCRTGHRPIAQTDQANAGMYETCNGRAVPVTQPRPAPGGATVGNRVGGAPTAAPRPRLGEGVMRGDSSSVSSTCLAQCPPGSASGRCIWSATPPPYAGPLAQLADAVIKQQTLRIEMALLAQNFRITGQPLARGPVVIEGNRLISNAGSPTAFMVPVPGLNNATARIELSPALEATIDRPGNNTVVLRPVSAAKGASIRFLNAAALDAQAGGRILAIESDGQRFMMQTPGACVGLPLAIRN